MDNWARQIKSLTTGVFYFFKKCGQVKEPYMETLKSVILDQEHITAVKRVSYMLIQDATMQLTMLQ